MSRAHPFSADLARLIRIPGAAGRLAKALGGVDESTVHRWIHRGTRPQARYRARLATVLPGFMLDLFGTPAATPEDVDPMIRIKRQFHDLIDSLDPEILLDVWQMIEPIVRKFETLHHARASQTKEGHIPGRA